MINKFQILGWILAEMCLKCIILVTNFLSAPKSLILMTWSCVVWPNKLIMTKSNLKKSVMTSFQWRHRNYVTEIRHQNKDIRFFNFGPLPIKISGYASGHYCWINLSITLSETIDVLTLLFTNTAGKYILHCVKSRVETLTREN